MNINDFSGSRYVAFTSWGKQLLEFEVQSYWEVLPQSNYCIQRIFRNNKEICNFLDFLLNHFNNTFRPNQINRSEC